MTKSFSFFFLIITFFISCSFTEDLSPKIISLNQNWSFHQKGDTNRYPATVPGNVHMDLFNANLIGDPFFGSNEDSLQWISLNDWIYETQFSISPESLNQKNIIIVFEGLDTHAKVFLNDSLILSSNNMFRKYDVNIRDIVLQFNKLRIVFESPTLYNQAKARELEYELPEERVFSRKAPYQFGWDWGPRFITQGIWRPIYIESWEIAKIEDIYYTTDSIVQNTAFLSAHYSIISNDEIDIDIEIQHGTSLLKKEHIHLHSKTNKISIPFEIKNPKLWWSNGLGEAYLYKLNSSILTDKLLLDSNSKNIGIRTIKLIQEKDEHGKSFYFELNGNPVFMKGANYIPQDNFLSRVNKSHYQKLIQSTVDANMNMLRVWGGGIYENDEFYDLCDKNGILVWQDFMFACAMYPGDSSFLKNVKQEAIDNIIRLRNHPAIALWCGNNEIDEAWKNWGWQNQFNYTEQQQAEIWKSYTDLFHEILPQIVNEYDPQRAYWASSPSIGWGHAESLTEGDSHYWGVWWGEQKFEIYEEKIGRFMSEYGFQGFPNSSTFDSVLLKKDQHFISPALQTHQKHPRGFKIIHNYMNRNFQIPTEFQDYIYISQLLQAEGIKTAIEAHRRAMPYCMGSLYWQLNDCWPVISWSSLDYYGNWKALHYQAKRSFDKLLVSIEQQEDSLNIYIVSDLLAPLDGTLKIELLNFSGTQLFAKTIKVQIPKNSSKKYYQFLIPNIIQNEDPKSILLAVQLESKEKLLRLVNHYFTKIKNLKLRDPKIQYTIHEVEGGYNLHLSTDFLAKNIQLSLNKYKGTFTDNYFDLLPKKSKTVYLSSEIDIAKLKENLKIKSLFNSIDSE